MAQGLPLPLRLRLEPTHPFLILGQIVLYSPPGRARRGKICSSGRTCGSIPAESHIPRYGSRPSPGLHRDNVSVQPICPTGALSKILSSPSRKNTRSSLRPPRLRVEGNAKLRAKGAARTQTRVLSRADLREHHRRVWIESLPEQRRARHEGVERGPELRAIAVLLLQDLMLGAGDHQMRPGAQMIGKFLNRRR